MASEEFTDEVARTVRQRWELRTADLVVGDAPGLVTDETATVASPADAVLYVVSDLQRPALGAWTAFSRRLGLERFGLLETTLEEGVEPSWWDRPNRLGRIRSVHNEEFDSRKIDAYDDKTRRILKQLTNDLLERVL